MADREGVLNSGNWANFAVILGVVASIFTGVEYSVTKINEHNALMDRVAVLEAQEIQAQTVKSELQITIVRTGQTQETLNQTVTKVDVLTQQIADLRVRVEAALARVERGR